MPTISAGSSSTFTLAFNATVNLVVDQGESVSIVVLRRGVQVFGQRVSVSQSFGPFLSGDVVQITAQKGAANYTLLQSPNFKGVLKGKSSVATRQAFPMTFAASGAAFTFMVEVEAPAEFDAVRLGFFNPDAAGVKAIGLCKIAPAAVLGDGGTGLTWTSVTFDNASGAAAGDQPTRVAGSVTTYNIPAATGAAATLNPGIAWSDWIDQRSIARTDTSVGTNPLIQARVYFPNAGVTQNVDVPAATDYNTKSSQKWRSAIWAGDQVTTPSGQAIQTTSVSTQWIGVQVVQFMCRTGIVNIMTNGDSIGQGYGGATSTSGYYGFAHVAADTINATSNASKVSVWSMALAGQTSAQSYLWARSVLPNSGVDKAIFHNWSPNDGSGSGFDTSLNYATAYLALCKRYGIEPIMRTAIPDAIAMTSESADAFRVNSNSTIASIMSGIDGRLFNADALLTDGAIPARMNPIDCIADGRHNSQTGINKMGAELVRLLLS
jgi:hypothetical protein